MHSSSQRALRAQCATDLAAARARVRGAGELLAKQLAKITGTTTSYHKLFLKYDKDLSGVIGFGELPPEAPPTPPTTNRTRMPCE